MKKRKVEFVPFFCSFLQLSSSTFISGAERERNEVFELKLPQSDGEI
jgi:hypothetical protein